MFHCYIWLDKIRSLMWAYQVVSTSAFPLWYTSTSWDISVSSPMLFKKKKKSPLSTKTTKCLADCPNCYTYFRIKLKQILLYLCFNRMVQSLNSAWNSSDYSWDILLPKRCIFHEKLQKCLQIVQIMLHTHNQKQISSAHDFFIVPITDVSLIKGWQLHAFSP